jgi:hypothetical protein
MTTERQIEANRQNAHASTGPRTPEGKAKVSRNPEKHGLFSRQVVIEGEDAAEFDAFAKGMRPGHRSRPSYFTRLERLL